MKAALYALEGQGDDKVWKNNGTGFVHFNRAQVYYRIIMRRDAVARTVLNMKVLPTMRPRLTPKWSAKNRIEFLGHLAAEKDNRLLVMMLHVADAAAAKTLLDAWLAAIDDINAEKDTVPARTGE